MSHFLPNYMLPSPDHLWPSMPFIFVGLLVKGPCSVSKAGTIILGTFHFTWHTHEYMCIDLTPSHTLDQTDMHPTIHRDWAHASLYVGTRGATLAKPMVDPPPMWLALAHLLHIGSYIHIFTKTCEND